MEFQFKIYLRFFYLMYRNACTQQFNILVAAEQTTSAIIPR